MNPFSAVLSEMLLRDNLSIENERMRFQQGLFGKESSAFHCGKVFRLRSRNLHELYLFYC